MEYLLWSILLVIIIAITLFTIEVKNNKLIKAILYSIAIILLIWKTIEFSYYAINHKGVYPVEISHISYFLTSIIILTGIKKLYFTGGLYAFISGVGYSLTALISPTTFFNALNLPVVIMGLVSHTMLLLVGALLLFKVQKYDKKDIYIPYIVLILIFVYVYLIKIDVLFPSLSNDSFVTLRIISFELLTYIGISDPILNVLATILVTLLTMGAFYLLNIINNKIFAKQPKKEID